MDMEPSPIFMGFTTAKIGHTLVIVLSSISIDAGAGLRLKHWIRAGGKPFQNRLQFPEARYDPIARDILRHQEQPAPSSNAS
jgi:hypothetical protein